jgi:DNA-binding MarR family transcriptional regulator
MRDVVKKRITELDDVPEYASWVEVVKTYMKCQRLLTARLAPLDLSIARYEVLLAIARDEGLSQRRLAERLLVAKSNVTALLQRLEGLGLIRRESDPDDARGYCVYLTRNGRAVLKKGVREQAEVVKLMMEGLGAQDARVFGRVMRSVGASLDEALADA